MINQIEQTYRELTRSGGEVLRLFAANPNDESIRFPPEILQEVYVRYLQSQEYHPHPKGLPEAREAIAHYYRGHAASVDPENILITSGTSESFLYIFLLLARPGDNLLIPNPAYPLLEPIARLARVELRHYPLVEEKNWAVDLEALRRKTDDRTRAIVIVSPHNPTGAVTSADEIGEIVAWANQREIPLICDEVFSEFYFGEGRFPRPIQASPPRLCFTLNGISKMFALPGLKLSWIAVTGAPGLVAPAVDRLETMTDTFLSCHTPIQQALPMLFAEGKDFLKSYRDEVARRRRLAIQQLRAIPGVRFVEPVGGFYLTARLTADLPMSPENLPENLEDEFVIGLMKEQGVFVHPGYFYDYEQGIHFVISFLTAPEKLADGLQKIATFINGAGNRCRGTTGRSSGDFL